MIRPYATCTCSSAESVQACFPGGLKLAYLSATTSSAVAAICYLPWPAVRSGSSQRYNQYYSAFCSPMFPRSSSSAHQQRIQHYSFMITPPARVRERKLTLDQAALRHLSPFMKDVGKCLGKIGSSPLKTHFEPTKEQQHSFRTTRYKELKLGLSTRRKKQVVLELEMDEIALDCYDYREQLGRNSIWKRYRSQVDQLSFRVLAIKKGKGKH